MRIKDLSPLEHAILRTVAYADLFDYPLRAVEVHRYLDGTAATLDDVTAALQFGGSLRAFLDCQDGCYALIGRAEVVGASRKRRVAASLRLWPRASFYAKKIAGLPYVRMVAVTGALAMNNEGGQDIDYLIVTASGRLWLCRALVILLVRWAAGSGVTLCPNYFISERALVFAEHNLYTAHELAQMVPVTGLPLYALLRRLNTWTGSYLPNAVGLPPTWNASLDSSTGGKLKALAEAALRMPPAAWVESWEMQRKLRKFASHGSSEAAFCADWCKGHFGGYEQHTLDAFERQMSQFQLNASDLLPIDLQISS
ncbi:MAG TPA: hypothetical protein VF498_11825 [Anaerolineales bacterium]